MNTALEMGWNDRTVKVDRKRLLETLKKNREDHQKAYEEAMKGYKEIAKLELNRSIKRAKNAIEATEKTILMKINSFNQDDEYRLKDNVIVIDRIVFKLPIPKNHTKAYDVAIQMAEWEVDINIELTQSQFQCFVMDDWEWKKNFREIHKTYVNM